MIKNRTAQMIYQTIYVTVGFIGLIASLGIFDNIQTIRWDFYVHFTNISNFLCIGVMLAALIQTAKKKEDSFVSAAPILKFIGMLGIKEINIVAADGIITNSTEADVINSYDMNSKAQSKEFVDTLKVQDSFVQEYSPRGKDESVWRKYAAVNLTDGGFIQVGYDAEQFHDIRSPWQPGIP